MGAFRFQEALDVLRAAEDLASCDPLHVRGVLATLLTVDGAPHERSGALALFCDDAAAGACGTRALGTLPEPLREPVERAMAGAAPAAAEWELSEEEDLFGPGVLSGRVELWLEPLDAALREALREARETLLRGEGVVVELSLSDADGGRRQLPPDHPAAKACYAEGGAELDEEAVRGGVRRCLRFPLVPMGKALLIGSGEEARRLAGLLDRLGFVVTVADHRPARLHGPDWDRARWQLVEGGWDEARAAARPDEDTYVVVMTRSRSADARALKGALLSPARYVGLAGPAPRAAKLLAELKDNGVQARPGVLSAPAGLDVGAETAEETAVAVAAEILAVRFGRKGGRPARVRAAGSAPASRRTAAGVPGLVLAAGRGRRFGGGSKMLADVDGRPVLRHVVEAALASRLDPVIVVLGAGAEAGLKAIEGIDDARLRVVFNPAWASGKASSFEVGLREAPAEAPGAMALLGDMPRVQPWLIDRVLSEFELSGRLCFPVYDGPAGPTKGHPTAYPRALFGEIRQLVGDDMAMSAIRRHWSEAVRIPLDDARTQADIDTARDLELLKIRP